MIWRLTRLQSGNGYFCWQANVSLRRVMESVVEERREGWSCWMILWEKVTERVLLVIFLYGSQQFIVPRLFNL